jgi:hypothetical protein
VGVKLMPVVVNGVPGDLAVVGTAAASDAAAAGLAAPSEALALDAAAAFRHERHELAHLQAARLATLLPLQQISLPFVFGEIGPAEVGRLADAFTAEVAALPGGPT